MKIGLMIFVLFFIAVPISNAICPQWIENSSLPACPTNGNRLLSHEFPVLAYLVGGRNVEQGDNVKELIMDIFSASSNPYQISILDPRKEPIPLVYLRAENSFFAEAKKYLDQWINEHLEYKQYQEIWRESLMQVSANDYAWNRDYFIASVNPNTGLPEMNSLDFKNASASRIPDHRADIDVSKIAEEMRAGCDKISFKPYTPVRRDQERYYGYEIAGGNVLSIPGGFCVHFSNQPWAYLAGICGDQSNEIEIKKKLIKVGHIDEVISVVKTHRDNVPEECQFSLVMPSVKRGIEILESHPQNLFFQALDSQPSYCSLETYETFIEKNQGNGLGHIMFVNPKISFREEKSAPKNVEVPFKSYEEKNKDMQDWLDGIKTQVTSKIITRLPQCKEHLDVIELPNLMTEDPDTNGVTLLHVFPNSVNLLQVRNTVLVPKTFNAKFDQDIEEQFRKRALSPKLVNTMNYLHLKSGGIHCATHEMRVCRP